MHGHKYKVGDKVRFADERLHIAVPDIYPPEGTVGTILEVSDHGNGTVALNVQWPAKSTSMDDNWWAYDYDVEPFEGES